MERGIRTKLVPQSLFGVLAGLAAVTASPAVQAQGRFPSADERFDQLASRTAATLAQRAPVNVGLPEAYIAADRDGDGQIGLYEWRKHEGATVSQFVALDRNGDGFLTPRELLLTQSSAAASTTTAPAAGTAAGGLSASATPVSPVAGAPLASPAPAVAMEPGAEEGRRMFALLDRNRDGEITPQEWERSERIRRMFEAAGLDLTQSITGDAFVGHYTKLNTRR